MRIFRSTLTFLVSTVLLMSSCGHNTSSSTGGDSTAEVKVTMTEANKANAENPESVHIPVTKIELPNGLRILLSENRKLPIFSYYTFFDVGGRYESRQDGTTGATHFLEHMMFKGAKKYGPGEFDSFIEGMGGGTNAYTTFDSTVYYQQLPSSGLKKIIDMEADRLQHVLLEKNAFEKERQVVLEERKMRYENSPGGQLFLGMMQTIFKGTPYGGSVIGDASDVQNLNREQMRKFFDQFYTPDNAIVVIVGDFDTKKIIKELTAAYGNIPSSKGLESFKKKMDHPSRFHFKGKAKIDVKLHGQSPTPIFMKAYRGVKFGDRKGFVMDILSNILGGGASSYFVQKYVQGKKPILRTISVGNYNLRHSGVFFIKGELLKGKSLKDFKRKLSRDVQSLCRTTITSRSLEKTKNQHLTSYFEGLTTNSGIAQVLGDSESLLNDYQFYKKELAIFDSITLDEVKSVCHEVFSGDRSAFVSVWNKYPKK